MQSELNYLIITNIKATFFIFFSFYFIFSVFRVLRWW